MADISQINLPNDSNNPYDITDANVPHSSLPEELGGADLSLVTTDEKFTWNHHSKINGKSVRFRVENLGRTAVTTSAGNLYVSENKTCNIGYSFSTVNAVFATGFNDSGTAASWIGVQSFSNTTINYVIYRHSSMTFSDYTVAFLIIGTMN